jgi:hypothetical protein
LIRAADRGHVAIVQELLQTDINIDHVNRLGWTALRGDHPGRWRTAPYGSSPPTGGSGGRCQPGRWAGC